MVAVVDVGNEKAVEQAVEIGAHGRAFYQKGQVTGKGMRVEAGAGAYCSTPT